VGENIEAGVTRCDGAVAVGDADDRLFEIVVAKTDRTQHCAIGRTLHTLRHNPASQILSHRSLRNARAVRELPGIYDEARLHHNAPGFIKHARNALALI
jgi:hypothetical protein